jgi:GTP-binding protein
MVRKLPRVVIVGFPNVGKSTLFNRLLRKNRSLVHSLPGMTRDCVAAPADLAGKEVMLVDTGGVADAREEPLARRVKEKAWQASEQADLILLVLDGRRGLLPAEEELFLSLKKLGKPVFVAVNKIDSESQEEQIGEFYRLGKDRIFALSAEHKKNLGDLTEQLALALPSRAYEKEAAPPLKIAVVGRINVGKSSLVNRLCGEERLLVSEIPGTTRDSTDTLIIRNRKAYSLIDTAGIRKLSRTRDQREKAGVIRAKRNIAEADVACLVLDAREFPTRQDAAVAGLAVSSGKPLLVALNKWDLVPAPGVSAKAARERIFQRLNFISYAPLLFVSALTGKGVIKILDLAERVFDNASRRIDTSRLNAFLAEMNVQYPPVSRNKKRLKIKYMTQKGIRPPTFFLFAHVRDSLSPSYEKFFIHKLREKFDLFGTPLKLIIREG